jgi:hypothetical protein
MTHCQALQEFPDKCQVSLHKNNKIDFPLLQEVPKMLFLWQLRSATSVSGLQFLQDSRTVPDVIGQSILVLSCNIIRASRAAGSGFDFESETSHEVFRLFGNVPACFLLNCMQFEIQK